MNRTLTRFIWLTVVVMIISVFLAACGGSPPAEVDTGDDGGSTGSGETTGGGDEPTAVPTLGLSEELGQVYVGEVLAPNAGSAALYVHSDDSLELIVATDELATSMFMTGTLEGQRVNLAAETGNSVRAVGRIERGKIELNITIPGHGVLRAELEEAETGTKLYTGTLNDLTAGLIALPDGTMVGFAPVEGGDEPVFEALCIEGGETLPDEMTANTCDTDEEVELTVITD
jgi:hypothetical protein